MIYSMTGFGQSQFKTPFGSYSIEIKTLNNRFLDVQVRIPSIFTTVEAEIRTEIAKYISRGTVYFNIYAKEKDKNITAFWNKTAVAKYVGMLNEIKTDFKLGGQIDINSLINCPGIISKDIPALDPKDSWKHIQKALIEALKNLRITRGKEGEKLAEILLQRVGKMDASLKKIKKRAPLRIKEYKVKLEGRISELLNNKEIDQSRIASELAFIADKYDIGEEYERLDIHFKQFCTEVKTSKEAGRKLNFILQEMNREVNTIGSKANDSIISAEVVSLKEQIETIREQVQNIE